MNWINFENRKQESRRIGFEFKYSDTPQMKKSILKALNLLKLDPLYLLYPVEKRAQFDPRLTLFPLEKKLVFDSL
jgi:hypothetical protein